MLEEKMLEKKVWAVIGASDNPEKYGNKIYKKLKSKGYTVYPVNPNYETIEGDRCYSDLSSLPEVPEVIDMVVSPKRGKEVIEEASRLGVQNIWLQPGTHNNEIMELIDSKGLNAVQACVLVALR
ncbi:CoA-binding protein [Acetivibrio mesophilus]|uniref:CoA-binding protein n=1 Tax=Acetivibrio mesophilus TaxID=2487273 RepID=A0A4V1K276_9FIRM|nr:CoA-binding protein [Acetivibrio mesophilus]ODM26814.1 CoA-binding protein [Clostridium sp. Bc-iso-3]RXE59319.1 CoA-binding protein [Acetivibrio mesophilus]HHV28395.1 CoA-binding protein [Clostridium sp.]